VWALNDDTHFAIVLALSKFMALYKDDNAKVHIEEDMRLLNYYPAANISTNELAFTVIFACSDVVVLETQHLDEEKCHEKIPKGKWYDYMLAKLPMDVWCLVTGWSWLHFSSTTGPSLTEWWVPLVSSDYYRAVVSHR